MNTSDKLRQFFIKLKTNTNLKSSLVFFQVIHVSSSHQSNDQTLKELNDLFLDILWSGKGDKIKRHVIMRDFTNGGLKMIDIRSFIKALKGAWMKIYLDENNKGKCPFFFVIST